MNKKALMFALAFSFIIIGFFVIFSNQESTKVYSNEERLSGIWTSDDDTTVEFSKFGYISITGEENISGTYTIKENNTFLLKRNDGHSDILFEYSFSDDFQTLSLKTVGSNNVKVFTKE